MENRLSRKALSLLCSPLSLGAMAALLVNDHLLRRFWPSWITGKLGDFAWLLFFPFVLAWVWALILPRRENWGRGLAFGITGGVFALAKTIPACHALVVRAAEWALGCPVGLVRDPSDLIALISLAAAWMMWERAPVREARPASPRIAEKWNRLALAAAALLTVANAARPPSIGIERFASTDDALYGMGSYEGYVSRDGGLSWELLKTGYGSNGESYLVDGETRIKFSELAPGAGKAEATRRILDVDGAVQYRYAPGEPIERTDDGGATWQKVYTRKGSPAEKTYYEQMYPNYRFYPGPLDAVADPKTGNVVFAMGGEGALVRTADGAWTWVEVGVARRVEVRRGEGLFLILQGELLLAAGFGLLAIMTLLTRWRRGLARKIFLALYWLLWGLNVVLLSEIWTGYTQPLDAALMVGGCIYLLIHIGIELAMTIPQEATVREAGCVVLTGLIVAAVFLGSYILWVLAVIPWYGLAAVLGVALGIGVIVWAAQRTKRKTGG